MKNKEKYKDELLNIAINTMTIKDGKPVECSTVDCIDCELACGGNNRQNTREKILEWLEQEAEPTQEEKCSAVMEYCENQSDCVHCAYDLPDVNCLLEINMLEADEKFGTNLVDRAYELLKKTEEKHEAENNKRAKDICPSDGARTKSCANTRS